jgi:2,4-dichlorophenol 6-monooxygenase
LDGIRALVESEAGRRRPLQNDTYNEERQPVGRRVIDRAMTSHVQIEPWSEAIGLRPGRTAADAEANIDELFGDSDAGAQRRKAVLEGVDLMNYQFSRQTLFLRSLG